MSTAAAACPHCGAPADLASASPAPSAPQAQPAAAGGNPIATVLFLLAVIFGVIVFASKCSTTPEEEAARKAAAYDRDLISAACFVTQKRVQEMLKAPSTAKFPSCSGEDMIVMRDGKTEKFTVIGHVDSQNGFGAQIRTRFSATAEHSGADASYGWRVSVRM